MSVSESDAWLIKVVVFCLYGVSWIQQKPGIIYYIETTEKQTLSSNHCLCGLQGCFLLGRLERQFRTGLCFARNVFFRHAFSEIPRPIAVQLCHMIRNWLNL